MNSEFTVREWQFSEAEDRLTIGLANIHASVPGFEENRAKIARALKVFQVRGVNMAIFPEFALSGYFWDDEAACLPHMKRGVIDNHLEWLNDTLASGTNESLSMVVLNALRANPDPGSKPFLNCTLIVDGKTDPLSPQSTYHKVFLPGIEKQYTASGQEDRLVIDTRWGRFGFITCYDLCFPSLAQELARVDTVDALVVTAAWRASSIRSYPGMGTQENRYYGFLWDTLMPASAATNQVWMIGCNAVGRHPISGAEFWGGSGLWAPSGIRLAQGSHHQEELLIIRNIDIIGERKAEQADCNYAEDFEKVYRPIQGSRVFTRTP